MTEYSNQSTDLKHIEVGTGIIQTMPQVIDYSDTDYAKTFWVGQNREYEDAADRLALKQLLPYHSSPKHGKILELGAGFGRLCPEYAQAFESVTLFDYAQNLLDQAKQSLSGPQFAHVNFKQGNIYELPFEAQSYDYVLMVRVSHHMEDFAAVIKQISQVLKPGGVLVMEYANKRHALEVLRAISGKSSLHPFDLKPESRTDKIFYNYHPRYIESLLGNHALQIESSLSVSNFRHPLFKKVFPFKTLLGLEQNLQKPLAHLSFGPSIYIKAIKR